MLTAAWFANSEATAKYQGASMPILVLLRARYVFRTTVMTGTQLSRRP